MPEGLAATAAGLVSVAQCHELRFRRLLSMLYFNLPGLVALLAARSPA